MSLDCTTPGRAALSQVKESKEVAAEVTRLFLRNHEQMRASLPRLLRKAGLVNGLLARSVPKMVGEPVVTDAQGPGAARPRRPTPVEPP